MRIIPGKEKNLPESEDSPNDGGDENNAQAKNEMVFGWFKKHFLLMQNSLNRAGDKLNSSPAKGDNEKVVYDGIYEVNSH